MDFAAGEDQQPIEQILSFSIVLSERIRQAVDGSKSYKAECADVGKLVDRLSQMLRSFVRFINSNPSFYDRPVRRIITEVSRTLNRALVLVRKCRHRRAFFRFVSIVGAAEFRKLFNLLEASLGDMKWLLSIPDSGGDSGFELSLPPIASNDPILAWVWSYISSLHSSQLNVKIEVANELCSLARDNDRNKKIIVAEGGIPPLLKLLKEDSSPEAQIAAATTLFTLANDKDRARLITVEVGVPIIVQSLQKSPTRVQITVAKLIARMAEIDEISQEAFARENVIRPLVTLLSFETFDNNFRNHKQTLHSIVEINKQKTKNYSPSSSSVWSINRKERENEPVELKLELKTSCAEALWMLAKGNLANSKILTDTKGLLCLAKLIETENGEFQRLCLMAVMEITAAAESNPDLRRAAFKTNSPAAKAVIDQLLRLLHSSDNPSITIPAIKAIGSLARTFPARETRVITPLVNHLSHHNQDVVMESAIALGKFACPENFLCSEHSKTIIESGGVKALMRLLMRGNERTAAPYHVMVLLCYLAMHAGNSEALVQAKVLTALEAAEKSVVGQHPHLKEAVSRAIFQLNMYHPGDGGGAGGVPSKEGAGGVLGNG